MNDPVKVCERCISPLTHDHFYPAPANADGRASRCIPCCLLEARYDSEGRLNSTLVLNDRNRGFSSANIEARARNQRDDYAKRHSPNAVERMAQRVKDRQADEHH